MAQALNDSKPVFADIRVLRRVGDETLFSQCRSEVMIEMMIERRVRDIRRPALQAVLAHNHRTTLVGFQIFRKKKDSVREDIGPYIQHDLVSIEMRRI